MCCNPEQIVVVVKAEVMECSKQPGIVEWALILQNGKLDFEGSWFIKIQLYN
jgi:hypothetical protein